jgi:hypothetical protein
MHIPRFLKHYLSAVFILISMHTFGQQTPFEKSNKQATATYPEVISYYKDLVVHYPQARLITCGPTVQEQGILPQEAPGAEQKHIPDQ